MVDEQSERLGQILDKASGKLGEIIGLQTEKLKDYLPTVTVDTDGDHWDLGSYLDQKAQNLTKYINEGAGELQDALEKEIKDFDEELPENKDEIISKLPKVEIKTSHPKKRMHRIDRFLDKGFDQLDKLLNNVGDDLDDLFN